MIKAVMLGDSGVGKTSFIHKFVEDKLSKTDDKTCINTIGLDFKIKCMDVAGKAIKF